MNKRLALIIVTSLVVILGGWLIAGKLGNSTPKPPEFTAPTSASISANEDGFEPQTLKIKANTVVVWKATDSESHGIAANPVPKQPELPDFGTKTNIGPDDTYTYKFTNPGTYQYHDVLNQTHNGTIVVE